MFDPALDATTRRRVLSAMGPWGQAGFILTPWTNESSYVYIATAYNKSQPWVCAAYVGMQMQGRNYYYAGSQCRTRDYVHEWGHVIGILHEHGRNDRDQYVILTSNDSAYAVVGSTGYEVGSYDFDSIMHYDAYGRSGGGDDSGRVSDDS